MKWNSVKDKLPDKDNDYLVITQDPEKDDYEFVVGRYTNWDLDKWWIPSGPSFDWIVVYWCEIPELPEECK